MVCSTAPASHSIGALPLGPDGAQPPAQRTEVGASAGQPRRALTETKVWARTQLGTVALTATRVWARTQLGTVALTATKVWARTQSRVCTGTVQCLPSPSQARIGPCSLEAWPQLRAGRGRGLCSLGSRGHFPAWLRGFGPLRGTPEGARVRRPGQCQSPRARARGTARGHLLERLLLLPSLLFLPFSKKEREEGCDVRINMAGRSAKPHAVSTSSLQLSLEQRFGLGELLHQAFDTSSRLVTLLGGKTILKVVEGQTKMTHSLLCSGPS